MGAATAPGAGVDGLIGAPGPRRRRRVRCRAAAACAPDAQQLSPAARDTRSAAGRIRPRDPARSPACRRPAGGVRRLRLLGYAELGAASCAPARARSRISTAPPLSLRPNRRTGSTRVSLNTSRSPGRRYSTRSVKRRSANVARGHVDHQQAAGGALRQRCLGDEFGRQGRSGNRTSSRRGKGGRQRRDYRRSRRPSGQTARPCRLPAAGRRAAAAGGVVAMPSLLPQEQQANGNRGRHHRQRAARRAVLGRGVRLATHQAQLLRGKSGVSHRRPKSAAQGNGAPVSRSAARSSPQGRIPLSTKPVAAHSTAAKVYRERSGVIGGPSARSPPRRSGSGKAPQRLRHGSRTGAPPSSAPAPPRRHHEIPARRRRHPPRPRRPAS